MTLLGTLVASVKVIPIKDPLIEKNQVTVITPEASYARALSRSARNAVCYAVMGISFGYGRPPDAYCSTFIARRRIDR